MAEILKGTDVAQAINSDVAEKVAELKSKGIVPTLAIVRIGDKTDQISYEKAAIKRSDIVGITTKSIVLPEETTQADVIKNIRSLNEDDKVHGVLILRPLPKHISDDAVRTALCTNKDVDGITDGSLSGVFSGAGTGYAPCTAQACIDILDYYKIDCTGKRAVVIGRSLVVGKPVAVMLMGKNATVTVCHTKTVDIPKITREADILIVAAGQMESITKDYVSPGQVVIDVGINWSEEKGKLCGDVKFDEVEPIVAAITPVPGGVGAVTTSVLFSNVIKAIERIGH
ncbi:MAG: bifunctional 5,10-methylene-tetrahydrofolate dehydrogenase/5,10-methylene-tetrahydrofolate cyclohydrolase [Oscillospiraceae bacterium]|nr:bifunctional 5,10-methylene-tetrahydrofolate dehydrogenase/5,10-methylene-tetrahydrofolate cyclohydrolase [Oscillospiraceae bacterium]